MDFISACSRLLHDNKKQSHICSCRVYVGLHIGVSSIKG